MQKVFPIVAVAVGLMVVISALTAARALMRATPEEREGEAISGGGRPDEACPIRPEQLRKRTRMATVLRAERERAIRKHLSRGLIQAGPSEVRDVDNGTLYALYPQRPELAIDSPVSFRCVEWAMMPLPGAPQGRVPPSGEVDVAIDGRHCRANIGNHFHGAIRCAGRRIVVTAPPGGYVNVLELRLYR